MQSTTEIWKDITGYEGIYQISNLGRVKSLKRWVKGRWPNSLHPVRERIISKNINQEGYEFCNLSKENTDFNCKIHRAIAEAFIPNICNLPMVNHINGIRSDNRIENLEWVTPSYNALDGYNRGRIPSNLGKRKEKLPKIKIVRTNWALRKKVVQLTLDGQIVDYWLSTKECSKAGFKGVWYAIKHNGICKGYKWKYAEN